MAVKNIVSIVGTASGTEQSTTLNAKTILWIANDGANDITFNFEEGVTTSGAFMIKAGEIFNNIDEPVHTIYYIATGGDTAFRVFGKAR